MVIIDGVSFNKKQVLKQFTYKQFCEFYKGHFKTKDVRNVALELGFKIPVKKETKKAK